MPSKTVRTEPKGRNSQVKGTGSGRASGKSDTWPQGLAVGTNGVILSGKHTERGDIVSCAPFLCSDAHKTSTRSIAYGKKNTAL